MNNTYLQKLTKNINSIPYDYDASLNGLGGWMVVFIIGHFLGILTIISSLAQLSNCRGFTEQLDTLVNITIIIAIIELILVIVALYYIFKRNILFRRVFVIRVVIDIISFFVVIMLDKLNSVDIISCIVSAVIWITYVYRSKRVKNTFIYPYCSFANENVNRLVDIENV